MVDLELVRVREWHFEAVGNLDLSPLLCPEQDANDCGWKRRESGSSSVPRNIEFPSSTETHTHLGHCQNFVGAWYGCNVPRWRGWEAGALWMDREDRQLKGNGAPSEKD
jgi:hypothetical protein